MPFSSYCGVLEPEHLDMLTRVLQRIVDAAPVAPDEFERQEIASCLFAGFTAGRQDEDELFRFGIAHIVA